jgi:hypothetical protein
MSKNVIAKNGIEPLKRAIAAGEKLAAQFFPDRSAAGGSADRLVPGAHASRAASRWTSQRKERVENSVLSASLCGGNDLLHRSWTILEAGLQVPRRFGYRGITGSNM